MSETRERERKKKSAIAIPSTTIARSAAYSHTIQLRDHQQITHHKNIEMNVMIRTRQLFYFSSLFVS